MDRKYDIDEFDEVCSLLKKTEVHDEMYKEKIYNKIRFKMESGMIQKNNKEKDEIYMKKNLRKSVAITVIAFVCLVGGFSVTAYGQETIQNILAYFRVGNITITQYEKELPKYEESARDDKKAVTRNTAQNTTVKEARSMMETDFAVPTWMPDGYSYMKSVLHSINGVELVYSKGESLVSLLISKGENGISTAGEVKREIIGDKTVYFTNGIVLWGQDGLTYELYQMGEPDFDLDTLGKIIGTMSNEAVHNDQLQYDNPAEDQNAVAAPAAS